MKFTYDTPDTDTRECVAYIDGDGDLIMQSMNTPSIWINKEDSWGNHCGDFDPTQATRKFYRGDSITITF